MTSEAGHKSVRTEARWIRRLRLFAILGCWLVLLPAIGSSLSWASQGVLAVAVMLVVLVVNRWSPSFVASPFVVLVSCVFTGRYALWRVATVESLFRGPGSKPTALDAGVLILLLLAELYSMVNLGLGYFQMLWPLRRGPVSLPEDPEHWPEVDLLIPTLNEPMQVLKYTVLGALNLDWPPDRLNIYVLDDGRREDVRAFCAEAGIGYMIREGNEGAKAGNLNCALERISAPFVAVFDADHVPVRSFLQMTMGWFDRDSRLGLLQTPHHLYSPDPFERNLKQFRAIPNEGELFYGVVQDGNDLWNATYFCGTGAVLRRAALDSVGGIATETVTEDAHTSLRMQKKGWSTAYINLPLAAGLATERLSGFIRQRRRWARGMVQILRLENPLFARGLTLAQRLCYFHATAHFLNAVPRLIFLTAPMVYLVFGQTTIPGYWAALLAYSAPHLALGYLANSRLQGAHRFSFWNEIYETVLAPFLVFPTLLAFLFPKAGRFDTTAKGEVVERAFFDTRAAWPVAVLLCGNLLGLGCALLRLVAPRKSSVLMRAPASLLQWTAHLYRGHDAGALWLNVAWTLFNLTILTVALGVASETRQRRHAVRLPKRVRAALVFSDGRWMEGKTEDVSTGGLLVHCGEALDVRAGEPVHVVFSVQGQEAVLPAAVVEAMPRALRVRFDPLTLKEEEALAVVLYSPADAWVGWGLAHEPDRPLRSLAHIMALAAEGLAAAARTLLAPAAMRLFAVAVCLLGFGLSGVLLAPTRVKAQDELLKAHPATSAKVEPLQNGATTVIPRTRFTRRVLHLNEVTSLGIVDLQGAGSTQGMHFSVAPDEMIQRADLRLRYALSGVVRGEGAVQVMLNGVVAGPASEGLSRPGEDGADHDAQGSWHDLVLTLPPELLVHSNELLLRLSVPGCFPQTCPGARMQVDMAGSELDLVQQQISTGAEASAPAKGGATVGSGGWTSGALSRRAWVALLPGAPQAVTRFGPAAVLFVCIAGCCLVLAFLLRAALRQRALLRLQP